MLFGNLFQSEDDAAMKMADPDYFAQVVLQPDGKNGLIHQDAVCILNDKDQTIAFLLPDGKTFYWVDGYGYFVEEGINRRIEKYTYNWYVYDQSNRKTQPFSWGVYLAASDLGGFALDLATKPTETTTALAKGLWKIATLQFDIDKTWERIVNADATDVWYVTATLAMAYLSGPKANITAGDIPQFREVLEEYAVKTRPKRLTLSEVIQNFKKGKAFELPLTNHLKTLYPTSEGYTVLRQIYVKVDGVMSVADNIIYNSKTGQFILNETKYGVTNTLRKNQKIIEDAVKAGKDLEIRSLDGIKDFSNNVIKLQGDKIKIVKVLRSNSIDGTITSGTVKTIWP